MGSERSTCQRSNTKIDCAEIHAKAYAVLRQAKARKSIGDGRKKRKKKESYTRKCLPA